MNHHSKKQQPSLAEYCIDTKLCSTLGSKNSEFVAPWGPEGYKMLIKNSMRKGKSYLSQLGLFKVVKKWVGYFKTVTLNSRITDKSLVMGTVNCLIGILEKST